MNRFVPLIAAALLLGCVRSPNLAKEMCEVIDSGKDLGPDYLRWEPNPAERERIWAQVVSYFTTTGEPPDSESPVCFYMSEDERAHVVFRTTNGQTLIQPLIDLGDGWILDYGEELGVWRVD